MGLKVVDSEIGSLDTKKRLATDRAMSHTATKLVVLYEQPGSAGWAIRRRCRRPDRLRS
jgi:hypothetical protein